MTKVQKNLDTLFALEFGQMLENHLFSSSNKQKVMEDICGCFELKSENQLAQIFTGFDTPTTAAIFELIRTLDDEEFTQRFFQMQTTNVNSKIKIGSEPESESVVSQDETVNTVESTEDYFKRVDKAFNDSTDDDDDNEFGNIDFSIL